MPSRKVTMRASMSNQISHFGIMGGLYNRKISGRSSMNRVTSRLEIPAGAASGLRYMKMHNLLSRNPLGSGGVGRMFNNRPRGSGLGSRSTTSDKSVSNLGSELGKHEEKVKGEDIYDTTNPAIPNGDCGSASAPTCFCANNSTGIVNCNAPCKADGDCETGDGCKVQSATSSCCNGLLPSLNCKNNCVGVSGDSGIMMGLSGGVLVASSNVADGQFCCTSVTTVNKKYQCIDSTKFCRLKDIDVSLCGKSVFLTCPLQTWQRYSCSGGSCIKDSGGELPSGCNGSCEAPAPAGSKYKCDPDLGTCSIDAAGTLQPKAACDSACVQNKYKCDPDAGSCTIDATGKQETKATCDSACNKHPPVKTGKTWFPTGVGGQGCIDTINRNPALSGGGCGGSGDTGWGNIVCNSMGSCTNQHPIATATLLLNCQSTATWVCPDKSEWTCKSLGSNCTSASECCGSAFGPATCYKPSGENNSVCWTVDMCVGTASPSPTDKGGVACCKKGDKIIPCPLCKHMDPPTRPHPPATRSYLDVSYGIVNNLATCCDSSDLEGGDKISACYKSVACGGRLDNCNDTTAFPSNWQTSTKGWGDSGCCNGWCGSTADDEGNPVAYCSKYAGAQASGHACDMNADCKSGLCLGGGGSGSICN